MIRKLFSAIVPQRFRDMSSFYIRGHGYLNESGWIRSRLEHSPVDEDGKPVPWYTYGSIEFLSRRLPEGLSVFEYGSGNSTIWWAERSKRVAGVEHNPAWFEIVSKKIPANASIVLHDAADEAYATSVGECGFVPDIVIIDGRQRMRCAEEAMTSIAGSGVIVWDNSDRDRYADAYRKLMQRGFRRVDFWGLSPMNSDLSCTSIFYRDNNCLNL